MIRNAFIAFAALVATAGTFGGTTGILSAQVGAPAAIAQTA